MRKMKIRGKDWRFIWDLLFGWNGSASLPIFNENPMVSGQEPNDSIQRLKLIFVIF
jgi:hypothetical protein